MPKIPGLSGYSKVKLMSDVVDDKKPDDTLCLAMAALLFVCMISLARLVKRCVVSVSRELSEMGCASHVFVSAIARCVLEHESPGKRLCRPVMVRQVWHHRLR